MNINWNKYGEIDFEELSKDALWEFMGRRFKAYAICSEDGEPLYANQSFAINFLDKDIISLIKGEILMIRKLKKNSISIEKNRIIDGGLRRYEIMIEKSKADLFIVVVEEITSFYDNEQMLLDMNYQLTQKNREISDVQMKVMSQEKMVGIGQLAAGVAHEINNPLSFVKSNFRILDEYFNILKQIIVKTAEKIEILSSQKKENMCSECFEWFKGILDKSEFDFISEDYVGLFSDTKAGLERVEKIVNSLRRFSRIDQSSEFGEYSINDGIEETLVIANNEIKYDAEIIKDMQYVPLTYANAGEVNQVILNILLNSVHAIREKGKNYRGIIKITTRSDDNYVYCEIMDNGMGIRENYKESIFVPFFTTKEVGIGTGLGMSISYDIITNKHCGELSFVSEYGVGTTFKIKLPIHKIKKEKYDEYLKY